MEIIESIIWVAAGFVPTIVALEVFAGKGAAIIKSKSAEKVLEHKQEALIRRG